MYLRPEYLGHGSSAGTRRLAYLTAFILPSFLAWQNRVVRDNLAALKPTAETYNKRNTHRSKYSTTNKNQCFIASRLK